MSSTLPAPPEEFPSSLFPHQYPAAPTILPSLVIAPTSAKSDVSTFTSEKIGYNIYIQPTYITVLPEWSKEGKERSRAQRESEKNLKDNKTKGRMSPKAQKRVRNAVNWLVQSSAPKRIYDKTTGKNYTFKINFLTLTLPAESTHITDRYFKKVMLHKFINNCRYKYGLRNYIWKVETHKSGAIHAHFTTDTFMHYHAVRRTWNKICEAEGLVDKFEKKYGHREPPSTEVKGVKGIKRIAAYMAKEMAKQDDDRRPVTGKIWSCSYSLSANNQCFADPWMDEAHTYLEPLTGSDIPMKPIELERNRLGLMEKIGEIYFMTPEEWKKIADTPIERLYNDHRFKIRHQLQDFPPEYFESLDHTMTIPKHQQLETSHTFAMAEASVSY